MREGRRTQCTLSGPSASAAATAVKAEIDAAREPDENAREAVLGDVVAHAQEHRLIGRLEPVADGRNPLRRAAPALALALPARRRDLLAPGGELGRERVVGIEREGGAVEHQLVLPADLINVDERQARLVHARHREIEALVGLVALERRAVDDDEDFRPRLDERLAHVWKPHVLANLEPEPHPLEDDRARRRARDEDALLVEDAVVWQFVLEADIGDVAALEQEGRVEELVAAAPGCAQDHGRPAVRRLLGEILDRDLDRIRKSGLQDQIFGRIAGDDELGRHHEIGILLRRLGARAAEGRDVARDVADRRVELRQGDREDVGHGPRAARAAAAKVKTKLLRCNRNLGAGRGTVNGGGETSACRKPSTPVIRSRRSATLAAFLPKGGVHASTARLPYDQRGRPAGRPL